MAKTYYCLKLNGLNLAKPESNAPITGILRTLVAKAPLSLVSLSIAVPTITTIPNTSKSTLTQGAKDAK